MWQLAIQILPKFPCLLWSSLFTLSASYWILKIINLRKLKSTLWNGKKTVYFSLDGIFGKLLMVAWAWYFLLVRWTISRLSFLFLWALRSHLHKALPSEASFSFSLQLRIMQFFHKKKWLKPALISGHLSTLCCSAHIQADAGSIKVSGCFNKEPSLFMNWRVYLPFCVVQ